jgi:uncharacterized oxidoreductase
MTQIDADELREFATRLLADLGAVVDDAARVAASLVDADRTGHTSHGVLRIPTYAAMIDDGALDPAASPTVTRSGGGSATVTVDGNSAFGQLVGHRAADVAVDRARAEGLACVGIRNATHLGRIGQWAERVTDAGLCFASFVNTGGGGLVVAPAGSTTRTFSTNPVTVGVPTFDRLPFPLVLDMATSQVAHGKLEAHESDGRPLPGEWAVTADGEPLTDPGDMGEFREGEHWGAIRPLGGTTAGYKGTGLAVVAELFAGLVGGAPVVGQRDPESWFSNGGAFLAIDPTRFGDRAELAAAVESLVEHFRAADSHPEVPVGDAATGDEPLLPGEAEYLTARERDGEGIPLPDEVTEGLAALAAARDVSSPFSER